MGVGDFYGWREVLSLLFHDGAHILHRFDNILAGAFGYLQSDSGLSIDASESLSVFEGAANIGDVSQGDGLAACQTDGEVEQVFGGIDETGNFNGKCAVS